MRMKLVSVALLALVATTAACGTTTDDVEAGPAAEVSVSFEETAPVTEATTAAPTTEAPTTTETPTTTAAPTTTIDEEEAREALDRLEFAAWTSRSYEAMGDSATEVADGAAALQEFDLMTAVGHFRRAADLLDLIRGDVPTALPVGQLSKAALDTCYDAYTAAVDAIVAVDAEAMDAVTTQLDECTAATNTATGAIEQFNASL
jgi:hypothetical protein